MSRRRPAGGRTAAPCRYSIIFAHCCIQFRTAIVPETTDTAVRTAALTAGALCAFAANSLLCRFALLDGLIDPAAFAAVRLASGAAVLGAICVVRGERPIPTPASAAVLPGFFLLLYALPFTFAYVEITAGAGALLLFGAVQITMIAAAIRSGRRPTPLEGAGAVLAFGGLVLLTAPWSGIAPTGGTPVTSPAGAALMILAGVGWGLYTLRGRRSASPIADTSGNFLVASIPALALGGASLPGAVIRPDGVLLAVLSGAVASGLGYAVWYRALRGLTEVRAAVVQLAVPVVAAAGGAVLLSEAITPRLLAAGAAVIGGIALTIRGKRTR